ncbi:hypothetical protein PHYBLDRAFT_67672 [Phycomyces blakesleeanus NRRL 1555(-)]|uniref:Uncharacterized protein n=1 Tax=Phycomyces blakesleeanus (strain ATCC 8743b / DSM 1359 / FGSC 10004 / NBRC 33097 / NRRL 1555) TaxID=763407 RepID=A0A162U8T9_PHYB8|nr:hypothetical protein PHYBLDRAFT_67672 [Phycomyces blakesleeanus NRRL 1555(-)]OAD74402.1 hypothetical protein PHYBLDRAFT_67672 [Phycomyces blakesleeanus NRRL 1555(-)]|eukprot:XP_018292442.1 hypothetical protein PHYBLDRAFT_67672 [Phycomyces blakesleeanus NRRL 1555(-)]
MKYLYFRSKISKYGSGELIENIVDSSGALQYYQLAKKNHTNIIDISLEPTSMVATSEEMHKKARRDRPAKKIMLSTFVGSNAFVASQSRSSINQPEFHLALKALPMKPVDPQYSYTVGPTEFVIAFFKEFVFKRTNIKSVSTETDIKAQIGLRAEDNEERQ